MPDILAVLHLADLSRDPSMKLPSQRDWLKIRRYLEGSWPQPIPPRWVLDDQIGEMSEWCQEAAQKASILAIDTEFTRETRYLTLIGLGYPEMESGLQIPWRDLPGVVKGAVAANLRWLVGQVPVVFQNTMADVPVLEEWLDIKYADYKQVEDTMLAHALLWSEQAHDLEFLASLYGQHPKLKHLSQSDPLLYNWGDVLATLDVWKGVSHELLRDLATLAIYKNQSLALIPTLLHRHKVGIRINKPRVEPASLEYDAKLAEATILAQAYCGQDSINLGSPKQLQEWFYGIESLPIQKHKSTKKPSVDDDSLAELAGKLDEPHPLIEARLAYAEASQIQSHYIQVCYTKKGEIKERLFPSFAIHAQASGRWSTTDPPLAQLPADLRDIICPDEGTAWIGWDWDQIELRLLAALSGDAPLAEVFAKGWDIHTLNCCDLFGYPYPEDRLDPHASAGDHDWRGKLGWAGKDDLRRVFAKRFVYRLNYGGDPSRAGDIPGAKALKLRPSDLVQASRRYLAAHPQLANWRTKVAEDALRTRESRTFMGRRRRLLGEGTSVVREAYNHPMQGGVSDIFNLTVLEIARQHPQAHFVFGMHDSQVWEIPVEEAAEFDAALPAIVERPWQINGQEVRFPAKFKIIR